MVGTEDTLIRVLIVDDAAESRDALRRALSFDAHIEVVGEAGSGPEAVARAEDLHPDIVLMDVRMPGGDGVIATRTIALRHPDMHIVALTAHDDAETVRDMLVAGATAFVVKGTSVDDLISAVHAARAGEGQLDERVLPVALDDLRRLLRDERHRRNEVERVARMREEFVHVLSHELRTPLTIMIGALRTVEQILPREDLSGLIDSALTRGSELAHLIEGLELIGEPHRETSTVNPKTAIANALERMPEPVDEVVLADDQWPGLSSRHLSRIAFELIENALNHGEHPIEVRAFRNGNEAVLEVIDAGSFEPDAGLLRPFVQSDMSTTREVSGMGLGLFVASRLCEALGGRLELARADDRTVARATFPLSD